MLRERLALRAVDVYGVHFGHTERAGGLLDAVAVLEPGDSPEPVGQVYLSRRCAVERLVSAKAMERAHPEVDADQIAIWMDGGRGADCARGIGRVLRGVSRLTVGADCARGIGPGGGSPGPSMRPHGSAALGTGPRVVTCPAAHGHRSRSR